MKKTEGFLVGCPNCQTDAPIGMEGLGQEGSDTFVYCVEDSLPLVRVEKNGRINLFAPIVEKSCISIRREKGSHGFDVLVILFAKDT